MKRIVLVAIGFLLIACSIHTNQNNTIVEQRIKKFHAFSVDKKFIPLDLSVSWVYLENKSGRTKPSELMTDILSDTIKLSTKLALSKRTYDQILISINESNNADSGNNRSDLIYEIKSIAQSQFDKNTMPVKLKSIKVITSIK